MAKSFTLKVEKTVTALELRVNDIPIFLSPSDQNLDTVEPVDMWIQPGENSLSIKLEWPEGQGYSPGLADCRAVLEHLEEGEKIGSTRPLAELNWPMPDTGQPPDMLADPNAPTPLPPQEYYPYQARADFTVDPQAAPPTYLWRQAVPVAWAGADKADVLDILVRLHTALDNKDIDTATRILDYKAVDTGLALRLSPDESRQSQREFFEYLFSLDDWGMEPIDPPNMEIHVLSDDRIVLVSQEDMAPALQSTTRMPKFLLPVYFAKIKDQWRIVR